MGALDLTNAPPPLLPTLVTLVTYRLVSTAYLVRGFSRRVTETDQDPGPDRVETPDAKISSCTGLPFQKRGVDRRPRRTRKK